MRLQLPADDGRCCRASCTPCRFDRRHEAFKLSNGLRCRSCCMGCCGGIYRHLVSICDKEDRTGGGSTHFHAQPHGMTQNILSAPAKAHQSEKRNRFLDSFFHPFLTTLNASSEADCKCPLSLITQAFPLLWFLLFQTRSSVRLQPGRCKISGNRTHLRPTESGDPGTAYETRPDAIFYVRIWLPRARSLQEAPAS